MTVKETMSVYGKLIQTLTAAVAAAVDAGLEKDKIEAALTAILGLVEESEAD